MTPEKCPSCGGDRIARSRTQKWDFLMDLFAPLIGLKRPYRCLNCNVRFWHKVVSGDDVKAEKASESGRRRRSRTSLPEKPAEKPAEKPETETSQP